MANFTSSFDLVMGALGRANELRDGSSPYQDDAIRYLNHMHDAVLSGGNEFEVSLSEPWSWARATAPATLTLSPAYTTGTITMTLNSTSGTFSSAPTASQVGNYIKVDGASEYYRISAHTAGAAPFTIDSPYNDTGGSGLAYKCIPMEYDLADSMLRILGPMRVYRRQDFSGDEEGFIYGINIDSLLKTYPMHLLRAGTPTFFSEWTQSQSGKKRVRFNQYVDTLTRVEYDYIPIASPLICAAFTDTDVATATDTITIKNHGLSNGNQVYVDPAKLDLPTGLLPKQIYYVISATQDTFKLSLTSGGSAVDITAVTANSVSFVSNTPLLPKEYRVALEYGVTAMLMLDKNDEDASKYISFTQQKLKAMVHANRKEHTFTNKNRGKLIPRPDLQPRKFIVGSSI